MFGQTLREFGVKISLAFDGKKVEEAQDKVEKLAEKLRGFALEVAGATAGVFEMQNLFTSNARSLEEQAQLLGIGTDQLQEYEYAAKAAADVNRNDLAASLHTLGDTMDKARAGDVEARMALEQIGQASGDANAIIGKLNDRTYKVTDAFHDMSKGIQTISKNAPLAASRLTEMTLGNTKLYNLLKQGPKAIDALTEEGRKNFVMNDKMIHQGYLMDVQMSKLWMTFRKFGYEIGYSVMKHLAPIIAQFTKWFAANKALIASGINAFLDTLADALTGVWEAAQAAVRVLVPIIDAVGGMKNAVMLLIGAWLAFKGISIAVSFAQLGIAVAELIPMIATMGGVLWTALAPILPVLAAIGASVAVLHDAVTLMTGGSFKDTWTSKGIEKAKDAAGWISDKMKGAAASGYVPGIPGAAVKPQVGTPGAGGSPNVTQENHFETNNTITLPPGTTASQASHTISKANVDSHERMMVKAKMDAARSRVY